ncbi:hypothetical protein [Pseudorhodoferax sp. Leaf274]|uniref:hypothetical protein n=1 Tax=Pseudorhodoferax sp. Leaf274 TaxID=1736318 RepID=UPI00070331D4|nr:hypothetical protein [Pseudorhodoferax sp. Leaf274]KQP36120.1 hypothetical protein ASF44_16250 [Pseudorhodoferax sp. Leaf274]
MTFAKIVIASDGEQVLFFKEEGDEGPELVQMTMEQGVTARLAMGFEDDEEGSADAKRDAAFDKAGADYADQVRKAVKGFFDARG